MKRLWEYWQTKPYSKHWTSVQENTINSPVTTESPELRRLWSWINATFNCSHLYHTNSVGSSESSDEVHKHPEKPSHKTVSLSFFTLKRSAPSLPCLIILNSLSDSTLEHPLVHGVRKGTTHACCFQCLYFPFLSTYERGEGAQVNH